MLLNNEWVHNETKGEIKRYLETKENEDTATPNQWHAAKAVPRRPFRALQAYMKKQEKSQVNNLILHLTELEEGQQQQ